MSRWQEASGAPRGDAYDDRWRRMAQRGESIHGEADLGELVRAVLTVLDAGCGTGRVAIELARRGVDVVGVDLDQRMLEQARLKAPDLAWISGDISAAEVVDGRGARRLFDVVVMAGNVMVFVGPGTEAAVVANMARHLAPGGRLVSGFQLGVSPLSFADYDRYAADAGLELEHRWSTWERDPFDDGAYAVTVHRRPTEA